jgi:hypothetical protein
MPASNGTRRSARFRLPKTSTAVRSSHSQPIGAS